MKFKSLISAVMLTAMPVCAAAQDDAYAWKPDRARKQMYLAKANLANIGLGIECEGLYNHAAGIRLEWRAGSERQLLNFISGWELLWHNPIDSGRPQVTLLQNSPYASLRLNCIRMSAGSIYAEGGASFNLNYGMTYRAGDRQTSDSLLVRNHFSTHLRMGFVTDNFDVSIFARYDLKPTFNQKHIYDTKAYDYYAMGPAINERWSIGLCMVWYIRFNL